MKTDKTARLFETASLEVDAGIATIKLNRPKLGNALNAQAGRELRAALMEVATTTGLRLLVVRAEGRAFCVGGDLAEFAKSEPLAPRICDMVADFHVVCSLLAGLDLPILTIIQGPVAGAGLAFLLLSDYSVAARSATFTYAYPGAGFSSDGGLTWLLPKALGLQRFRSFALLGQSLSAEQATEWGLLCEVVDDDDLSARADKLSATMASGPTSAFGAIRRLLLEGFDRPYAAHLVREMAEITTLAGGVDPAAAIASLIGRRPATFTGR